MFVFVCRSFVTATVLQSLLSLATPSRRATGLRALGSSLKWVSHIYVHVGLLLPNEDKRNCNLSHYSHNANRADVHAPVPQNNFFFGCMFHLWHTCSLSHHPPLATFGPNTSLITSWLPCLRSLCYKVRDLIPSPTLTLRHTYLLSLSSESFNSSSATRTSVTRNPHSYFTGSSSFLVTELLPLTAHFVSSAFTS